MLPSNILLLQYLNMVKRDYGYVLVTADSGIIPTRQHFLSAKGLGLLLQTVSRVRKTINPILQTDGILMTMVRPTRSLAGKPTAVISLL